MYGASHHGAGRSISLVSGVTLEKAQEAAKAAVPEEARFYTAVIGESGATAFHYRKVNGEVVEFDHRSNHMAYRDELEYVRAHAK